MEFLKMHGLGNDFVVLDARKTTLKLDPERVRSIADRRRGVGCDQLIILEKPADTNATVFMRIYNPDGSESGACGNATRCIAHLISQENATNVCVVETISGLLYCTLTENGQVTVDMGVPLQKWDEVPLSGDCNTLSLPIDGNPVVVSMGNPHCVFFCGNVDTIAVDILGPKVERNELFPERTNVEYVSMLGPDHLRMRVWERGAGITQACGTGACAAAVAAIRRGLTGRNVRVTLDGGDLFIEWRESDGHVLMTGPVAYSFKGDISLA